jgi:hypothetical protein
LFGSLLTTGVNWIPAVLPTGTVVVVGAGFRAIETLDDEVAGAEELLLQAARKPIAAAKMKVRIRRIAATANLLENVTPERCPPIAVMGSVPRSRAIAPFPA